MIKVYEYSHLGGSEILKVRYPEIEHEIDLVIAGVTGIEKTKESLEKTKQGKMLYSPPEINKRFSDEFRQRGYHELRESYVIELPGHPVKIKGAFKQIDFVKRRVLVEVQFGKYFFNENRADVGVEIVPWVGLKRQMSSGVSYGEQLVFDIERLKRHFPAVPVKVILIGIEAVGEVGGEVVVSEGL
jgi:hypothetical protein